MYCEDQHYLSKNYYLVYKFTNCHAYNLCYWIVWLTHNVYIKELAFVKPINGNSAKFFTPPNGMDSWREIWRAPWRRWWWRRGLQKSYFSRYMYSVIRWPWGGYHWRNNARGDGSRNAHLLATPSSCHHVHVHLTSRLFHHVHTTVSRVKTNVKMYPQ